MPAWLENLIKPFAGNGGSTPALALGAFGKHPGWDDHIEDVGLETEPLLTTRQLLYVQGIGGVIDSAVWDKLQEDETLPAFGHTALWFAEPDLLAARLWASQDGKGRARYPMVVCAHAANLDAAAALARILPVLEKAERACRETNQAAGVNAALASLRQELRDQITSIGAGPPPLRANTAARLGFTAESDEWCRIVYAIESQLAAHAAGKVPDALRRISPKMITSPAVAQVLRLPSDETALASVALFWRDLVTQILRTNPPQLFLQPTGQPWIDLIVGAPTPKQLYCLKASTKTIPLADEVPYNLPPEFLAKAAALFREFVG